MPNRRRRLRRPGVLKMRADGAPSIARAPPGRVVRRGIDQGRTGAQDRRLRLSAHVVASTCYPHEINRNQRTREKSRSCAARAAALIANALAAWTASASLSRSDSRSLAALSAMSTSSATGCQDWRIARERCASASSPAWSGPVSTSAIVIVVTAKRRRPDHGLRKAA